MTGHALLAASSVSERKDPRYVFKRRGLLTAHDLTLQIKTLDVSMRGFGIIAAQPLAIGKSCSIILHTLVGDRMIHLDFSCQAMYCILAGVDGFRIGLHIDGSSDAHKKQLQNIIASCPPAFL